MEVWALGAFTRINKTLSTVKKKQALQIVDVSAAAKCTHDATLVYTHVRLARSSYTTVV